MSIRKYIYLSIFVFLSLLMPIFLFYVTVNYPDPAPYTVEGGTLAKENEAPSVDFYSLVYKPAGGNDFTAPEKNRPEQEPSPIPEVEAGTGNVDKSTGSATGSSNKTESVSSSSSSGSSVSLSQKEKQMLDYINDARKTAGLPALQLNSQLTSAARAKSKDMVDNNYFSHSSPTYGTLEGLLKRFGINYRTAGENLAMNSNGSVSAAHNSLMGSPGHRANILNSGYTAVGIGIHVKSDGSHYYTQLFIGR
ncbi:MAG: CAP domain-containing protein [Bacillota bacterium]|nr:CAP domain-containing protein [Bacillota bacterium]